MAYVPYEKLPERIVVDKIRRTKELGFNCVLSFYNDGPVSELMPLVRAADKYGIRIIWVNSMMEQFANPALQKFLGNDTDRYIGADGRKSALSACPTDTIYWKAILFHRALPLAELAAERHIASAGLLLDIEDYTGTGDWFHYCYCERDFNSFLNSLGRSDVVDLPAEQRYPWLVQNNLLSRYYSFQDSVVVRILTEIRKDIDAVNPDFLFAIYPWYEIEPKKYLGHQVRWDRRLAAGLGKQRAPFLFFIEHTYEWGYDPFVEAGSAQLSAEKFHFVPVSGFNVYPSFRVWWPDEMAYSAYYASIRSGGYWVFRGDLTFLPNKGDELSPQIGGTYEEWGEQFKRINGIIEQTLSRKTPGEGIPTIPLPPVSFAFPIFRTSDLFEYRHAEGSTLLNRQWTKIGLPWSGGELVLLANKPGEWFSFERDIRMTDRYEISGLFTLGPDRGQVQLYVGGEPVGEPVNLYAPTVIPQQWLALGRPLLQEGRARLELRVAGKNPQSQGHAIGLTALGVEQIGWWPTEWNVILPFDNTGKNQPGYMAVYPPEQETRLDATYRGKGDAPVKWQVVQAEKDGYVNFQPLVSDIRDNVAYALVYAYCPTSGMRKIFLGSDDGGKLWVNDSFVWGENVARSAKRNDDSPVAYFNAGWNKILIKVTNVGRSWGFYLRIYDPENTIRYALRPEK